VGPEGFRKEEQDLEGVLFCLKMKKFTIAFAHITMKEDCCANYHLACRIYTKCKSIDIYS
jgi:hypothetical protein